MGNLHYTIVDFRCIHLKILYHSYHDLSGIHIHGIYLDCLIACLLLFLIKFTFIHHLMLLLSLIFSFKSILLFSFVLLVYYSFFIISQHPALIIPKYSSHSCMSTCTFLFFVNMFIISLYI